MSQKNAIPPLSRPPPSQTAASTAGAFVPSGVIDATGDLNNGSATTDDGDAYPGRPARVHDHNRPFPPPRLPVVHTSPLPSATSTVRPASPSSDPRPATTRVLVTAPLTPLSSSFRSRPSLRQPAQSVEASNEANTRGLLPTTETTAPPRSPVGAVSLTVPRPDVERTINEYVEAPFKHCCNQDRRLDEGKRPGDCPKTERRHRHKGLAGLRDTSVAPTHRQQRHSRNQVFRGLSGSATSTATSGSINAGNTTTANAVTKQPVSFTKEPASTLASRAYDPAGLSIMCDFCGRCRCESCREPPPLPSRWLCDNSCYCSADTILDYASCLCCVKGLFYHCADGSSTSGIDGEAAGSCADEPCSCTGTRRTSRWACLSALTLVMPCLLCYWPLKGCVAVCETCYARHASQGCKCNPNTLGNNARHHPIASDIGDSRDPEKRLLDPVTPEL